MTDSHSHTPGHSHGVTATGRNRGRLALTLGVSVVVFAAQLVGAKLSGSLALFADAGHVLADAGGVALALGATLLAARPALGARTFGWARAEVLAATVNGLVLLGMGAYVFIEGVRRLLSPDVAVSPGAMAVFGAIGLIGNAIGVAILYTARKDGLNMRGAFLEVLMDAATSVGVLMTALVVAVSGFARADAVMSILIGLVIAPRAGRLLWDAVHVLLEAAPKGTDLEEIKRHIREVEHVRDVHDLHVHTVTSGLPVLSAHVVVEDGCFRSGHTPELLDKLQDCAAKHFEVEHATFQLEPAGHTHHERGAHQ